ncbi:MFS transporter [Pontivivens ytuae]|uniref:MFS transporter n=1 Tax=Pontivivens ytuae TaxID=2789856 RepID=A0A7S9QBI2_9RHOB|nr:MFS transporter [Pontivivens ytuae]QPH52357.1 MFS transporter [Pontivivens ytuae]
MLIPILSLGNFAIGMGVFVAIGLIGPLSDAFSLDDGTAGLILTIYAVSYAIGSPLLVALTGHLARRTVMITGLGIFGVSAAVIAMAPSAEILLAARAMSAFGAGLFTPITAGVAASISARGKEGKALATVFAGLTFAQVLGVPAGTWIGYQFGWETSFWVVAILSAICLLGIIRYVPRDLPFQASNFSTLAGVLRDWRALMVILFTATFLAGIYVVYTYLGLLLESRMGYSRDGVTSIFALFGAGAVAGNFLGGWLADRAGPVPTLTMLCIAQAVLMPGFALLPMDAMALFALMLLWAIFGWSFVAGQQIRVVRANPERATVALALNAAAIYIGAALGSTIGGHIITLQGLDALGIGGALVAVLALVHLLGSERLARG